MPELENGPPAPSRGARVDGLLAAVVVAFAFLAASFVARNSDLWLHLAAGRLLAFGDYHFGTDPFAYTTAGRYWANHAWLFDLGLYLAFTAWGGAGLVLLKAAGVAATAALMLLASRGRDAAWVAAGCVLLAVLATSPRLLLQPSTASLLLLAACLFCLRTGGKALAAVPVLIAVWVNVDAWFILGPVLVGLFALGRLIDRDRAALPAWPRWLVPASLAACLVSPHHVFALTLPPELSPAVWRSEFASDPRFAGLFVSPWHWAQLGAAGGYNLAAWAFQVLLALGLVSFAVNRPALRGWRAAVWLPFALLAAWQARLIPFFAVVAGPITALNLREAFACCPCARAGRVLALAAGGALCGLAWFGWATGFDNRERGAAWAVYTSPTLERAARGIAAAREAGAIPAEARVFATHPDAGHYLAWFSPGERAFLDIRLNLFTPVAADFAALSRGAGVLPAGASGDWQDALKKHGIAAILISDPDFGRMTRPLRDVEGWELARVDGAAVLLVPHGTPGPRFDAERVAFGGDPELGVAGQHPPALARPAPWWEEPRRRGRAGSWEADAATVYLRLFEQSQTTSPALLLLAIRAARLGAEADPSDPFAWFVLGRAYLSLGDRSWEHEAGAGLTPLEHVRLVQLTTAFTQAVLRNPDSLPAREALAGIFLRRNVIDLGHLHLREALRLVGRGGPVAGESAADFGERVAGLVARVEQLEAAVQNAENRFLIRTAGLGSDPLARARVAAELGLTQKAADVLLASHPDLYGPEGLGQLADWLLQLGQAAESRVLLDRISERGRGALGEVSLAGRPHPDGHPWAYRLPTYDWLDLCQCAAAGDYAGAAKAIDRLAERLRLQEEQPLPGMPVGRLARETALHAAAEVGARAPRSSPASWLWEGSYRQRLTDFLGHAKFLSVARADLTTLAGVLELERGDARAAARRFGDARATYSRMKGVAPSLPGEPLATRYDEAIRKWH